MPLKVMVISCKCDFKIQHKYYIENIENPAYYAGFSFIYESFIRSIAYILPTRSIEGASVASPSFHFAGHTSPGCA